MDNSTTTPGEEVVWTGSVSQWHYGWRWFFVLLLLALVVATFFEPIRPWFTGENADRNVAITRAALGVIAVAMVLAIWIDRGRRKYMITTRRVGVEYGIVSNNSNEIRIHDIRSINLETRGLSGVIGIGRLEFSSAAADEAEVVFEYVPRAEKIRDIVRNLQAQLEAEGKA